MSAEAEFWTKNAVKRHMLPAEASEYSTERSYSVGDWVWNSSATTPGLHVCKTAITYISGTPHPWSESEWTAMPNVSVLFSSSNTSLTGVIDARLPYALNAAGTILDRNINIISAASATVPNDFTDLLIRATVASSLAVTMPSGFTVYGDAFPGESGEWLVTITKTGSAEAFVRSIKMEVPNA